MPDIQFKDIDIKNIQKNVLYKVSKTMQVPFTEVHEDSMERVILNFKIEDEQFGIYATEYRAPVIKKAAKRPI